VSKTDKNASGANTGAPRRSFRRRLLVALAIVFALVLLAIGVLPFWLGTGAGARYLLTRANNALAPARLEVDRFSWSWFQPTTMRGFRLRDAQGNVVVSAPEATWDNNLRQALFEKLELGTLHLPGAALAIERDAEGTINLLEALRPVLERDPRTTLAIDIPHGTLSLHSPELLEPIVSDDLKLLIQKPGAPAPWTFSVALVGAGQAGHAPTLELTGKVQSGTAPGKKPRDLELKLAGDGWPIAFQASPTTPRVHGTYSGAVSAQRKDGVWQSEGMAKLADIDLDGGPVRGGDHIRLAQPMDLRWNVGRAENGWDVTEFAMASRELTLEARGTLPTEGPPSLDLKGQLDLAALASQLPRTLSLNDDTRFERGMLQFGLTASRTEPGAKPEAGASAAAHVVTWTATGRLDDLVATRGETRLALSEPLRLDARLTQRPTELTLEEFGLALKGLNATGSGDVDRGIAVVGSIDLAALDAPVRELVGLGDSAIAGSGPFELHYARLAGAPRYEATVEANLRADQPRSTQRVVAKPVLAEAGVPAPPAPGLPARPAPGVAVQPQPATGAGPDAGTGAERTFLVDATLEGPTDPAGWPSGWSSGHGNLDVHQGNLRVRGTFAATGTDGQPDSLKADLTGAVPFADRTLAIELALAARREQADWSLEPVRIRLEDPRPAGGKGKAGRAPAMLDLSARGTYSPSQKSLHLVPIGRPANRPAFELAADGLVVDELGTSSWKATLALEGDAAGFDSMVGSVPRLAGRWSGRIEAGTKPQGAGWSLSAHAHSADLALVGENGKPRPLGPLDVAARLDASESADRLEIPALSVDSRYARLEARGQVDEPMSRRLITLDGQLAPRWDEVNAWLKESLGPDARVAGRSRNFFVRGPLPGGSDTSGPPLTAEFGIELDRLEARGLTLGPTPLVARWREGRVTLASIDTSLNEGRIVLHPLLDRDAAGQWVVSLDSGSGIANAVVNESMTHSVLAYVAPPLDNASRISGKVSAVFDRVSLPLGEGASDDAVVEGQMVFHDVVFAPGPLALALYRALDIPPANIRLDQPVSLSIHDGVVEQRGFAFPLGDAGRVTLDGNVAFDRSMDLIGTIGLSGERFASVPVFNQIAPALRLDVPIGGTLDDPKIDGKALARSLGRMGLNAAAGAGLGGIGALLDLMNKPPPTPEEAARMQAEREARRQEQRLRQQQKQEERRLKREQRRQLRGLP
jgi:translocation and assembly module TamB